MDETGTRAATQPPTREPTREPTRRDRVTVPEIGAVYLRRKTWYLDYWLHGKQYRESAHTQDQHKALKLLAQRHSEIARDEFIKPQTTKVTMNQLFDLVVADYQRKGNRSDYTLAHRLKPLRDLLGDHKAVALTERTLEKYRTERLNDKRSTTTINRELAVIRRAFKLATRGKDRLVSPNTMPAIELYPENNAREGIVEYPDFLELVRHLPSPIDDVCWFAYLMGWRREQVLELRWTDVNRQAGTIIRRAEYNKTKEPSVLAMSEGVRAVIERRHKAKNGDRVFHRGGKPIVEFRGAWIRACSKAGLFKTTKDARGKEVKVPTLRFHDFRRAFVSNQENAGTPRKVAKSLSGHVTDSVYERYHIVRREDQLAALARVEAGFTLLSLTNSTTNVPKHNSSTNGTQEVLKGQQLEGN